MNLHCTTALVRKVALIGIEDLHVSGILKNHKLAQAVSDVSWAEARRQLEYKAPAAGSQVVAIDRFYPSSKTCNQCGYIHTELDLKDREWYCWVCKRSVDRDLDAARNIRDQAWRLISA